jgi:hypothetical protein
LKDMVRKQISSCERLLINTKDIDKRNVIQRETLILKLVLELLNIDQRNHSKKLLYFLNMINT